MLPPQVASMDPSMGRFATRIMLQAHRQEILLVRLPLSWLQHRRALRRPALHVHPTYNSVLCQC